jgi:hypothetical protein
MEILGKGSRRHSGLPESAQQNGEGGRRDWALREGKSGTQLEAIGPISALVGDGAFV